MRNLTAITTLSISMITARTMCATKTVRWTAIDPGYPVPH